MGKPLWLAGESEIPSHPEMAVSKTASALGARRFALTKLEMKMPAVTRAFSFQHGFAVLAEPAVAVLEFLAGTARAGFVAPDLPPA